MPPGSAGGTTNTLEMFPKADAGRITTSDGVDTLPPRGSALDANIDISLSYVKPFLALIYNTGSIQAGTSFLGELTAVDTS